MLHNWVKILILLKCVNKRVCYIKRSPWHWVWNYNKPLMMQKLAGCSQSELMVSSCQQSLPKFQYSIYLVLMIHSAPYPQLDWLAGSTALTKQCIDYQWTMRNAKKEVGSNLRNYSSVCDWATKIWSEIVSEGSRVHRRLVSNTRCSVTEHYRQSHVLVTYLPHSTSSQKV
jgi:hypothetical protein